MDVPGIQWVIERINWLIDRFAEREDKRTQQLTEGIDALVEALMETRLYYGTYRQTLIRDRKREEKLSRIWVKTSNKLRRVDEDLADRCNMKGQYWADPQTWTDNEYASAIISIENVERALIKLKAKE